MDESEAARERRLRLKRRLVYPLQAAALYALYWLFWILPIDVASGLCGRLARAVGPRLPVSRRAVANLRRALPERDAADIRRIVADMWENLGRVAGEYPHLPRLDVYRGDRVEMVGAEIYDRLRDDGQGAILFSGHLANWDLPAISVMQRGLPLVLIYRPTNNAWLDRMVRRSRSTGNERMVAKGREGARAAVETLARGGNVGMLVDQKMNDGIPVPFFGRDAMTAPGLAVFALRYRCPVVPVRVERLRGARFRITVEPPIPLPDSGDRQADIAATMAAVNAVLERWVRERPEQWLWLHRRWPD